MELILENVRCFAGKHIIPIKPLTILVGENSSGKSTALAMLSTMGDPVGFPMRPQFNEAPYDLGSFRTIATLGGEAGGANHFSVGYSGGSDSVDAGNEVLAKYQSIEGQVELTELRIKGSEGRELSLILNVYHKRYMAVLSIPWRGRTDTVEFAFDESFGEDGRLDSRSFLRTELLRVKRQGAKLELDADWLTEALKALEPLSRLRTLSIAPIRTKPRRTYDQVTEAFDPEGNHIPLALARILAEQSTSAQKKALLSGLKRFGQESRLFSDISLRSLGDAPADPFQVMVTVGGRPTNLLDVGYGVSQVLPLVVQGIIAAEEGLLLIQQPEVHLHPRAQAALGSLLVDLVAKDAKQFVIETHSDYIVDRIRMEIADGKLPSDAVVILYLEREGTETTVYPIKVDSLGNLIGVPPTYREFFLREEMNLLTRGG